MASHPPLSSPTPRWLGFLALLFAVACLWRWAYIGRLSQGPFAGSLAGDAREYWNWAGFLTKSGVLGAEPFFLAPLYPYVLACLRGFPGFDPHEVLFIQAVWGSVAVVLLADATRRLTSSVVGATVGLMACVYEMAVFYDGLILSESLLFLLEAGLLWLVATARSPASSRRLLAVGLMVGLLTLGRGTLVLLLLPAIATLVPFGGNPGRTASATGCLLLGPLLCVGLVAARNFAVSKEWIPLTYNLGYNLYVGNNPHATGGWVPVTAAPSSTDGSTRDGGTSLDGRTELAAREGRPLGAGESSRLWSRRAGEFVAQHPERAARLALRKAAMMWSRHEYPQIESVDVYRRVAGPVGLPLLGGFALVGVLAIGGAGAALAAGPAGRFLVGYVVVITAGVLPFFVTDRFRLHLVPASLMLAGLALAQAWTALRRRDPRWLSSAAPALVLGLIVVLLPVPHLSAERRAWQIPADIGGRWLERGRADLALPFLQEAGAGEAREAARQMTTITTRLERARLHADLGTTLIALGRPEEAIPWLERANAAMPADAPVERALAEARRVVAPRELPDPAQATGDRYTREGWAAGQRGDMETAARLFQAAIAEDPRAFEAWTGLVRAELSLSQLARAESTLSRARVEGLPDDAFWGHRAAIDAMAGNDSAAQAALARVSSRALSEDFRLREVVTMTRRLLSSDAGRP